MRMSDRCLTVYKKAADGSSVEYHLNLEPFPRRYEILRSPAGTLLAEWSFGSLVPFRTLTSSSVSTSPAEAQSLVPFRTLTSASEVAFPRHFYNGVKPNISSYLPKAKHISLVGCRKTLEKCMRCGVDYEVPVLTPPTNVHNRHEVISAWEELRIAEQAYANSVSDDSHVSSFLLARDGAMSFYERTVHHYEQEEDNANRHLCFLRNQCRESHQCNPNIYVPPSVMEAYMKGLRDYESSKKKFKAQEDNAYRDFLITEDRYHRSRASYERDHKRMLVETEARDRRMQADRDAHYERMKADREIERQKANDDRIRLSNYEFALRKRERKDSEFGFSAMANLFLNSLRNSAPSPFG